MESNRKKGYFTFRATAVLFILSAVFEFLSMTSETIVFGEVLSGIAVGIYHIVYVASQYLLNCTLGQDPRTFLDRY